MSPAPAPKENGIKSDKTMRNKRNFLGLGVSNALAGQESNFMLAFFVELPIILLMFLFLGSQKSTMGANWQLN
jgi:hypothetical protein